MKKKSCYFTLLVLAVILAVVGCKNPTDPTSDFTNVEDIAAWLERADGGETVDNPVPLKVSIQLRNMTDEGGDWRTLLNAINIADKYVALDLSDCTMTRTEFITDHSVSAGKNLIVSIILPTVAQSISAGTSLETAAFRHFTRLAEVTGTSITNIGAYAFAGCTSLVNVSFPAVTSIGERAFAYTGTVTLAITTGSTAPAVGTGIFDGITEQKLVSVWFPSGATGYGQSPSDTTTNNWGNAFRGGGWNGSVYQTGIVNAYIMLMIEFTNMESITAYLASVNGGDTVNNPVPLTVNIALGEMGDADSGWQKLVKEIGTAGKYIALDLSTCSMVDDGFYPGNFIDMGQNLPYPLKFIVSLVLPLDTKRLYIGGWIGVYFTNLRTVHAEKLTAIDYGAFEWCASLQTVSFPAVTSIDADAFSGCISLETINFPVVTSIGYGAFAGCASLKTVNFPAVTSIASESYNTGTFAGCISLETVSFPIVATIGYGAFAGCISLETVSFPVVTSIGEDAFYECTSLQMVSFPVVASIGKAAFAGCINLQTVSLPIATSIGTVAFDECTSLQTVSFPAVTFIDEAAFAGCINLQTVSLPVATFIGYRAFAGCTSLANASFPVVTNIGNSIFSGTGTAALTVTLGPTAPAVGSGTFVSYSYSGGHIYSTYYVAKNVTVMIPLDAIGYGISPSDTTTENWGNAFRGMGWDGTSYLSGTVSEIISLVIQRLPE